jgi:hypothetical protein
LSARSDESHNRLPPLPEHVVDQMAKEIAKYTAPLFPHHTLAELEELTRAQIRLKPVPLPSPVDPDFPSRVYLTLGIAWYDLKLRKSHVGDFDGPTWWFGEQAADA